jgi:hypothetical protein
MYCSRCAAELQEGSGFCSKCGQQVGATPNAKTKPPLVRRGFIVALAILLLFIAGGIYLASRSVRSEDTANITAAIKRDFEKRGFTVDQINMVRESDTRLSGFAKVRKSSGLLSNVELTKNCVATKDMDSGRYIWECK